MPVSSPSEPVVIVGRSSSHFTRVARIIAAEVGVEYSFRVVRDLMSTNPDDYGGNPALRLPTLIAPQGTWFGALNISRELERLSGQPPRIVWPEALAGAVLGNAQEFALQAMATEVTLIMDRAGGQPEHAHAQKLLKSLEGMLRWLETEALPAIEEITASGRLSFLEVTLFCLVTHLEFREVLATSDYPGLERFAESFAARPSAASTGYYFDS